MDITAYFTKQTDRINGWLDRLLPALNTYPPRIHEAMRYAIFSGGKRIRPILAVVCAEAVGATAREAMIPACAIECLHAYSLVHDDLPCMDDDDIRRGRPTAHRQFDEATAVLAGDALLTYASEMLARVEPPKKAVRLIREIMTAVGTRGMLGGQIVDIEYQDKEASVPVMDYINIHKTGKLIAVSCLAGAIAGGAPKKEEKMILTYGEHLGFVFQLIDDIIDHDGYVKHFGERACLERSEELITSAKKAIAPLKKKKNVLNAIADFVLERRK